MLDKRKFSKAVKEKYSFKDETFVRVAKDNPKDKVEIEIGDSKQPDFKPQVKVQRWDNEVNLSFRLKDDGVEEEIVETKGEEIVWKKGKREAHFYDLHNEEHPEGAYEFEVIETEPSQNEYIDFSINTKDVDFFKQPPLTEEITPEQIAQGYTATETDIFDENGVSVSHRSEEIVNSLAVYAKTPKTNWAGGKEYRVGKVGHIPRSKVIDAVGSWAWTNPEVILNPDGVTGTLRVHRPQAFLDNAVYPVRHAAGLTFGYTSIGGTTATASSAVSNAAVSPSSNGTLDSVTYYSSDESVYTTDAAVYDSSFNLITSSNPSNVSNSAAASWDTNTMAGESILSSNSYYIFFRYSENITRYYDAGASASKIFTTTPDVDWPNPASPTDGSSRLYSIYATYTASGGSDPTPLRMLMGMGT